MPTPDSKISGALKTILKKYWWILTISIFAPIIINFSLLIPSFTPVVGTNIEWLSFFGSYIAAIIPALGSFIILFIQREDNHRENKKREWENERNRQLQLDVLKYQQEIQWLNEKKNIFVDFALTLNKNNLIELANKMGESQNIFLDAKHLLDSLVKNDSRIGFISVSEETEEYQKLMYQQKAAFQLYRDALIDLQQINKIFIVAEQSQRHRVMQECLKEESIKKGLKDVIATYPSYNAFLMQSPHAVAIKLIFSMPDLLDLTRKAALVYVRSEEDRISQLLGV